MREIWQQRALTERGLILLTLRQSTGPYLDSTTIRGVLDRLGMPTDKEHLTRHLHYLREKGYIRCESTGAMGLRMTYWTLTASGRDVLLGVIEEPGVLIPDVDTDD